MHLYTVSALVCVLAVAGIYHLGAQGSQQYDVEAAEIDNPRDRFARDLSSLEGFPGDVDTGAQRPEVNCKVNQTSAKSCQNFAGKTANNLNEQIEMNLIAAYDYDAMALFFHRDDIAYRGFAQYFTHMAHKKRHQAEHLKHYLVLRGARWMLKTIPRRDSEWQNPLYSLNQALRLERLINKRLLQIHDEAGDKNDPHLENFLENELLGEQVSMIHQLSDWVSVMNRLEDDVLGWTVFDEEISSGARGPTHSVSFGTTREDSGVLMST